MGWAPVGATVDEKNILLGDLNSIDQLDPELRFERTGGPPVACRASVPRIVCAKLFGIGIVCAVSASYAPTADAALSCALSCAIAWVASVHYFFIWKIRAQSYGPSSAYASFMTPTGRSGGVDETTLNAKRLQARETSVDGFRYSDWTVTLVLMAVELGRLAESANPTKTPIVSKFVQAALMPVMTSLGGGGRFFGNELRRDADGRYPSFLTTGWWSLVTGALSYLGALGIWVFVTVTQLDHVGRLEDIADADRHLDGLIVYCVVLVQVGYPIVAFGSVLYLNLCAVDPRDATRPMPGSVYSPGLSTAKVNSCQELNPNPN